MELYQRLKDYFHLTSIQANEILASYQEEDILENLRYVEGKIKEGQVRTIGAYTLKAIKENYRHQPNLFEQKQREKQQALDDKIQQQRDIDRLHQEYEREREESFQRYLQEFPSDRIAVLKDEAAQEMETRYGSNFRMLDTLIARRFKDRLLECASFPTQEEWIQGKAAARPSVRECSSTVH